MAIVIDMFPLGHVFWQYVNIYTVLGQHYNDMLIGLHHVEFVQRNSGYNTFMNAKMCTNRNSDVEKRLSRRWNVYNKSFLRPPNRNYTKIARGVFLKIVYERPPIQSSTLSVPQQKIDQEWNSGRQVIATDNLMIM